MEVIFLSGLVPSDQRIPGFDGPCGRSPSQTCYGLLTDKSDVFEMIPYDLSVAQVVMLFEEAVVQRLKGGISGQLKPNRLKFGGFSL
jgi:hypothetical protein